MVYTTLSVFQHSLDLSICCYMETVPGERRSNLKDKPVLEAYNADGFKLVRRTLTTDRHLPVCDSCPYGSIQARPNLLSYGLYHLERVRALA